jgi:hypothetical protein
MLLRIMIVVIFYTDVLTSLYLYSDVSNNVRWTSIYNYIFKESLGLPSNSMPLRTNSLHFL